MNEYHYSKLTVNEQSYYKTALNTMQRGDSKTKPMAFATSGSLTRVMYAISLDHPEMFFVDFKKFVMRTSARGMSLEIGYVIPKSKRTFAAREVEDKVSKILELASKANLKNEFQKCRWIHDYIVRKTEYHYDALNNPEKYPNAFTIWGSLLEGKAVCEGFAKVFKLLCDKMGVNAMIIHGTSKLETFDSSMEHAWNIVRFNNDYVHIDTTWDRCMSEESRYTRYDYFCISDKDIQNDHAYSSFPVCETDSYSFFSKKKRFFSNTADLQKYLDFELKNNGTILYFKIKVANNRTQSVIQKINEQVARTISKYATGSYSYETMLNDKMMCFFFRIKK